MRYRTVEPEDGESDDESEGDEPEGDEPEGDEPEGDGLGDEDPDDGELDPALSAELDTSELLDRVGVTHEAGELLDCWVGVTEVTGEPEVGVTDEDPVTLPVGVLPPDHCRAPAVTVLPAGTVSTVPSEKVTVIDGRSTLVAT